MHVKLFDRFGRGSLWRDVGVALLLALGAGWLAADLQLQERIYALSRRWEYLQLDESLTVALVFSVCMIVLYARRFLQLRRAVAENRRLALRNLEALEEERRRLAQELHDDLGQYLNAIKLDARGLAGAATVDETLAGADRIASSADHAYAAANAIVRRLRPPALDDLGLNAALEACVLRWRQSHPQLDTQLVVKGDIDGLPDSLGLVVYRLVQEGLTNCVRHANATRLEIEVAREEGASRSLSVRLQDNGQGRTAGTQSVGHGIAGMRERVELLGGRFRWLSVPGRGVTIEASFTWPEENGRGR